MVRVAGAGILAGIGERQLIATEVRISAVHVFDLGSPLKRSRLASSFSRFRHEFTEQQHMQDLTTQMFSPERFARQEEFLQFDETTLQKLQLSNGKTFEGVPVNVFISLYSAGIAVALLYFDLSGEFTVDELMELAAMTRGSYEKIKPGGYNEMILALESSSNNVSTFEAFFTVVAELLRSTAAKNTVAHWGFTFTSPFVYVKKLKGKIMTKSEMIKEYPYQLAGLASMWINHWRWVKREEVEKALAEESHPLEYGFTIMSPLCSIEIHPLLITEAAKADNRTLEYHHFVEWYNLAKLLEIVSLQFYAMRKFDHDVSRISASTLRPRGLTIIKPFLLFLDGVTLARESTRILPAIEDFWGIRLTRRTYILELFSHLKEIFLVNNSYQAVQEKLAVIERTIDTTFNMLTTIFVLLLTIVSTVFGILAVVITWPR